MMLSLARRSPALHGVAAPSMIRPERHVASLKKWPSAMLGPARRMRVAHHGVFTSKFQHARGMVKLQKRAYGGGSGGGGGMFGSPDGVVYALIGANVVVTGLWATADTQQMRMRMVTMFTTSARHLENGHYHTLLTAVFSHADFGHLFTNMLGLFFFGREISYLLGPKRFLGLYVASGVISSWAAVQEQKRSHRMSLNLGASGAVNSITALSILLYPFSTLLIFGIVPIPAWIAGSMFIGRDLYGWLDGSRDGIGHFAHLSGAACGGLYYAHMRRSMRRFR